jgi:hypothetical protein
MRLLLFALLISCTKNDRPPPEVRARAEAPRERPEPVTKASADVPTWVAIDNLDGAPAKPTAWKPDGRPTLVVFSASWCPGCTASALADRMLVHDHGKQFQVGVALAEADKDFEASSYAQALSGVPVWSEASTAKLSKACHPVAIPSACLYENGKVVWDGGASEASAVLDAHQAGKLDAWLASADAAYELAKHKYEQALHDPSMIPDVVALMHGHPDWQNSFAWDLVDREAPPANEVAVAVALARDAVAFDHGIDFAHLDTYALALAKAGRVTDAAYVGERVLAVCKAVQGNCRQEKQRALEFIAAAR